MASETTISYSSMSLELVPGYLPYIADVAIDSFGEPFKIEQKDKRSHIEINQIKHHMRDVMYFKHFPRPVKLLDYCLIAKEKWDGEESCSYYSYESVDQNCCKLV
ncbi:hypothetical protein TVAG_009510 [Trichomonas vaginalis G3]|uniref:Uncharacterized protein n=1 Tax=Trichomonas vaginalis (strain ATCC PRA-98 / G3) TaxID=412133 RepID=A2G155_TRIV3|nr:hypothetical protein TVAGG3_0423560 [Trichomonas vaginalis G3]EAX89117.1 hypothetical protein TVAG_009510 [Trichomonas vaginalis G3]KAI5536237.1 hypothetical protein TVAGG3_0423560 [Trichomonas vaginalis G3]|eukprot:XP_001302047.1 hypothetical protein [Trichomonas vaginalis G3]